jgi:hypothetical protein
MHSCSVYNSFRTIARLLEFLVDLALVILSLVAFLVAAVMLDTPTRFHTYEGSVYFSLPSFYLTYSGRSVSRSCALQMCALFFVFTRALCYFIACSV